MSASDASGSARGPVHTFVVPVYGKSPHLAACLASLQTQTFPSQVVVTTSTPYDGLAALVSSHGATLGPVGPGGGIGRDWNHALAQASTPWVTLAHQDDLYLPNFAEATMAAAAQAPDAGLVLTGYAELLDGARRASSTMLATKRLLLELGFLGANVASRSSAKRRLLRFGCPIPCPSVTLRMDADALRFREDLRVNLDWDAWWRLASRPGSFVYVRECLMLHRIHADSETTAGIREGVRAREDRMMFEAMWPRPVAHLLARGYALSYGTGAT